MIGRHGSGRALVMKIVLPVALAAGLLMAVGVLGAWNVHRLHSLSSDVLALNVASIRAAEELEITIRETRFRLNQFLLTGDQSHLSEVRKLRLQTDRWMNEAERFAVTEEEQGLIRQAKAGYEHLVRELDKLLAEQLSDGARDQIARLSRESLSHGILTHTRKYLDLNEQQLVRSSDANRGIAGRLAWGLLLLGTCGAVAGVVVGYGVARGIGRTILQLSLPIRDVAGQLGHVLGPIAISADPDFGDLGRVLQLVSRRVTKVIEQLHESQRAALRAEQLAALGQLAAGLAHELRNPLMSMKILVQSGFERDGGRSLDHDDLVVLETEITRLEQLVQALLDFARPPELNKQRVDLNEIVEQSVKLVLPQTNRGRIRLVQSLSSETLTIEVDVPQFRQVILNLLLNALDAVPEDGLICVNTNRSGDRVSVSVSDSGCGLPEDLGERIFDPFVSTKETGIGLGLSISRRIVHAHGGEITAENGDNGGAVLQVWLPIVDGAETKPAATDEE